MTTIKIDSDVPLPVRGRGNARYPFSEMQVGQSFLVNGKDGKSAGAQAAAYKRHHPGWDYTSRTVDGGTRVWRTA